MVFRIKESKMFVHYFFYARFNTFYMHWNLNAMTGNIAKNYEYSRSGINEKKFPNKEDKLFFPKENRVNEN